MKAEIRRFGGATLLYGEFAGSLSLAWRAESEAPRPRVEAFPATVVLDRSYGHTTRGNALMAYPPEPFSADVESAVREGDEILLVLDISHGPLAAFLVPEVSRRRHIGDPLELTGRFEDGVLEVSGSTAFKWRPEKGADWERADLCVGFRGTAVERPSEPEGEAA